MISVAHGYVRVKDGIKIFTGIEEVVCPICGGKLRVHGTCMRKLRTKDGVECYRLRVMACTNCNRTHRELPAEMIPYKRNDQERICQIAEASREQHLEVAETSTWARVRAWVDWFLCYAQMILSGLRLIHPEVQTECSGSALKERMAYYVRAVVNSGNWIQHRSV